MENRQAIYLGFGLPYLTMALISIKSLRRFHTLNDLSVKVISNYDNIILPAGYENLGIVWENIDQVGVETTQSTYNPFKIKAILYNYFPARKTVFIDSDTIIMRDLNPQFALLDYYDILIRPNIYPPSLPIAKENLFDNIQAGNAPHYSTAVHYFRRSMNNDEFFRNWAEFHGAEETNDQLSFARSAMICNSKIGPLTKYDNAATSEILRRKDYLRCAIHHYASDYKPAWSKYLQKEMEKIYLLNADFFSPGFVADFFDQKLRKRVSRGKNISISAPGKWNIFTPALQGAANLFRRTIG